MIELLIKPPSLTNKFYQCIYYLCTVIYRTRSPDRKILAQEHKNGPKRMLFVSEILFSDVTS